MTSPRKPVARALNTVGGAQYLGGFTDTIPTIAHIESHARIVSDQAGVRRMIEVAHEIVARGATASTARHGTSFRLTRRRASFEVAQKRSRRHAYPRSSG